MVTHVPPPPSPSLSSTSLSTITGSIPSYNPRLPSRTASNAPSGVSLRHAPSSYRPPVHEHPPTSFPPSPPLSHSHASSPSSSYIAPRFSDGSARDRNASSRAAPSVAPSRATEAARHRRQRSHTQRPGDSRPPHSTTSSSVAEEYDDHCNEFPWFGQSGDIEILLNNRGGKLERKYKLHSLILRQSSRWWDDILNEASSTSRTPSDWETANASIHPDGRDTRARSAFSARSSRRRYERNGEKHQYATTNTQASPLRKGERRFTLDWAKTEANDGFPILVAKPICIPTHSPTRSEQGSFRDHPPTASYSFFRSLTSRRSSKHSRHSSTSSTTSHPNPSATTIVPPDTSEEDADSLSAYATLFGIMYNHSPALDAESLPDAYVQSKTLLRLAAQYKALDIVRPRVEHHLLHFNRALYKNIARYPPSYLRLGHLLRSRKIFGEALIHIVGQWPVHEKYLLDYDERIRDLIEDKNDELTEARNKVDARLFRVSLAGRGGEKVGPSMFLDWMAVCLFRDWLAGQTPLPPKSSILKPSTTTSARQQAGDRKRSDPAIPGQAYRLMVQGGDAYLSRGELKEFLKYQAPRELYSREGLKKLERRMDEIKVAAREHVRGLCKNSLEGSEQVEYLVCTKLEERDLEWLWADG